MTQNGGFCSPKARGMKPLHNLSSRKDVPPFSCLSFVVSGITNPTFLPPLIVRGGAKPIFIPPLMGREGAEPLSCLPLGYGEVSRRDGGDKKFWK